MRQLTFIKPGTLEWWEVPEPKIEAPIQALVRPVAVASCDLDAPILRGEAPFSGPFAFGHEFATQDILIRVITHLSEFRQESAFSTWVYRIATNYLLTTRKRRAERQNLTFQYLGAGTRNVHTACQQTKADQSGNGGDKGAMLFSLS